MPIVQVHTSLPRSAIAADLASKIAAKLGNETLRGKTIGKMYVQILPDQIIFTGTNTANGPTVFVKLSSIGSVTREDNRKTATTLTDLLHREMGVESGEIRIQFFDIPSDMIARGGVLQSDL